MTTTLKPFPKLMKKTLNNGGPEISVEKAVQQIINTPSTIKKKPNGGKRRINKKTANNNLTVKSDEMIESMNSMQSIEMPEMSEMSEMPEMSEMSEMPEMSEMSEMSEMQENTKSIGSIGQPPAQTQLKIKVAKKITKNVPIKKTTIIVPNRQSYVLEKFKLLFECNGILYDDRINDLCKRTERAIYEFTQAQAKIFDIEPLAWENPKFTDLYMSKSRSVITNLDPKSYLNYVGQEKIIQRFFSGTLTPENLVNALPHELAPDRWKSMIEQRIHEAKISSKAFITSTTDLFKCGKCKQRKCTYYQMQTRSQDEPMTTFITCVNCGNKWRE